MPGKVRVSTGDTRRSGVVEVINPTGRGGFVLVCEHATNAIPDEFDRLGLRDDAIDSHIAWDPGALQVAREMAARLDAPLVAQRVSRLVYDCNRHPGAPDAIPSESELYQIPGNADLSQADRSARASRFYEPFRAALADLIDRTIHAGRRPVLLTVHSFTPVYAGVVRDTEIGILHDRDTRYADLLLESMQLRTDLLVRRNAPYGPEDGVTHTLREHAISHGLMNAMIEIRNDLIADRASQLAMAERLSKHAADALAGFGDRAAYATAVGAAT